MGSRSMIGSQQDDGTIRYIYCHLGASPRINGQLLQEHYGSTDRVHQLLQLGPIQSLGPDLGPVPGQHHTYDEPAQGVTVAYHRDRGEDLPEPSVSQDRDALAGEEWAYLFIEASQHWEARPGDDDGVWRPIDQLIQPPDEDPILAELKAKLDALTRGTSGDAPGRRERRSRGIGVQLPTDHADALAQILAALGLEFEREEDSGQASFRLPAGEDRNTKKSRHMLAMIAAARVASGGVRVDVQGPGIPREVQLFNDQVVSKGTHTIDFTVHRSLLRKLEGEHPNEAHPLVSREVARDRQRDGASAEIDTPEHCSRELD